MPAIARSKAPSPRQRSCVAASAPSIEDCSTSRSQRASRASSRSRRPPRNSIALVRQTVGSRAAAYSSISTIAGSTNGSPPVT